MTLRPDSLQYILPLVLIAAVFLIAGVVWLTGKVAHKWRRWINREEDV